MDVLVAGGTGFIGTALCERLAERGHDVTAMARSPESSSLPAGVEGVAGDVTDRESVEAVVAGRDAVYNLVALSPLFQTPSGLSHEAIHLGGTENLLAAAESASVDRFCQLSGLGSGPDAPTEHLRVKHRAEVAVEAAPLETVIVRPSVVFGENSEFLSFVDATTTAYVTPLPAGGRMRFQPIWIGDLAPMLADCVDGPHAGETYELGGPDRLTLADVTRLFYASRDQSVRIVPIPMALSKLGLTLAGPVPFVPFGPEQAQGLSVDNTVDRNAIDAFGVEASDLRSLADYLGVDTPAARN
ncbi:NAD-dependent epimerase/dehydratase [Halovivax asiaticus JCM 14624]|uniref:NAD-dependent epimerase/dehydratase n=1 Tax=Halovivax asiaticus JCM 14624 TaxID=1227490 RepID=M0BU44_9EURY|nr:complex I NDUFA9 subunit family protein [Halovivax asiaticus]ELZ13918.1 NAD-dependent epimerase/dehydratase [Halovivax asiaticus JCM 14624]